MKKILITRKLIKDSEDKATKTFESILNTNDELYSQQKVIELSQGCDGILTSLTTWTSDGGTKVSSKTFSYTSGNLTSVVEKDGSDVTTLTKTIAYDGDGNVSSITKDYA